MLDRNHRHAAKLAHRKRDARYRERVRRGERVARVTYGAAVLDLLVKSGALRPEDCDDHIAVGKAIAALLLISAKQ